MTHADLARLSLEQARAEILGAASEIRSQLGVPARQFAYPYGHLTPAIVAVLRAAGFASAVTTKYAWQHDAADAMEWGRLEVHSTNLPHDLATLALDSGRWVAI
jgi:peptidoglycan/xylan/chitin deacetylase (PgdA/CDA1 family)